MKFYNYNLIGSPTSNVVSNFSHTDSEHLLTKNKEKIKDWVYNNIQIEYSYNENGHRCKALKDIDLDNYILFVGCSNTEGIGLKLEHTFPYIVSSKLSSDYYNLGIGSTGIDVMEYNLFTWLKNVHAKPKFIVVQWTDYSRFLSKNLDYETFLPCGAWLEDTYVKRFITDAEITNHNKARKFIFENLLKYAILDIPIIRIQHSALKYYDEKTLFWPRADQARDLIHPGIKSNEYIANLILENLR